MENIESDPKNKAELLERIQREWSALMHMIPGLSDERMSMPDAGGWSIKDNLAHLTAWEQFMLRHYIQKHPPHEAMQVDAASMEQADEDGLNAIIFEKNRKRSVADVLAELRRSHEQVVATLEQMTFEDMLKPRLPDDPERRPLIDEIVWNTYEHYREHGRVVQALLSQSRSGKA